MLHKSSTSLRLWFEAIFLVSSAGGISARQLERELGVTYKTAWRMLHLIRSTLVEDAPPHTTSTHPFGRCFFGYQPTQ